MRTSLRARTRCCACRCAGRHDIVNEHNFVAGDRGAGDESISCIGESAFFVQSMLGSTVVTIQ
jgi:hypothetical protein